MAERVLTYPMQGCLESARGDHILLTPPFLIAAEECRMIARAIAKALDRGLGV